MPFRARPSRVTAATCAVWRHRLLASRTFASPSHLSVLPDAPVCSCFSLSHNQTPPAGFYYDVWYALSRRQWHGTGSGRKRCGKRRRKDGRAVIVWLWDAGSALGVTDDESRARQAAETFIHNGRATVARVEKATLVTGIRALNPGYARTGQGWTAQPRRNGWIRWVPLLTSPEVAAS